MDSKDPLQPNALVCKLCNQPLSLGPDTVADEDGGTVHEQCYADKMKQKMAPRSANPQHPASRMRG